jgi:hypothetical protein
VPRSRRLVGVDRRQAERLALERLEPWVGVSSPAVTSICSAAAVASCREPISSHISSGTGSSGPKLMSTRSSTMCACAVSRIVSATVCTDWVKVSACTLASA